MRKQNDYLILGQKRPLKTKHRKKSGGPVVKTLPSNVGGTGLIPGQGTKILYAMWPTNKKLKNNKS